ncbi:extracellular solute-binding protein [Parasalinivibrio latis]|uniref:ABC transporter substrate-binding protein n=1 Tax=Parasalinivibrio latis TaxID=2952610 RepID=UPI0030E59D51
MSRTILKTAFAASLGLGLAAPSFADEITVWAWDKNFNVASMEKAAELYIANNPGTKISVVEMGRPDIEQKLHTMLSSGMTKALPDIVLIEDYASQKYLTAYPDAFAPLSDDIDFTKFIPYKVEITSNNGKVYGLPFDSGVTGVFVRTDILKKAGYTVADLENITWDRYIEIGKDVLKKTGTQFIAIDPNYLSIMRIIMHTNGAWFTDEKGEVSLAGNKDLASAMDLTKEMFTSGIARTTGGWNNWVQANLNGNVATIPTGVWFTQTIVSGGDQSGNWAVVPTPRLDEEGTVNAANLGGSSWYVLESSPERDEAIKFMKETLGDNSDLYQKLLDENNVVASYTPSFTGEAYNKTHEYLGGQKIFADFAKWMEDITPINYGMYTIEAEAAIIAQMPAFMAGEISAEQALEKAQIRIARQIR